MHKISIFNTNLISEENVFSTISVCSKESKDSSQSKEWYSRILSNNSSCFLYLCQSTFGNINWEKSCDILNRATGLYPIIAEKLLKTSISPTTPSNIVLWQQLKTLHLSNPWLYIYLDLFQEKKWNACCKITFPAISDRGRRWTLKGAIVF